MNLKQKKKPNKIKYHINTIKNQNTHKDKKLNKSHDIFYKFPLNNSNYHMTKKI